MKTSPRRSLTALTLLMLAAGTLTACGTDEPAEFDTPQTQESPEPETTAPADPSTKDETGDADGDAKATPDPDAAAPTSIVGPEDAIDTIVYELPGADARDDATVTVGLHSLQVEGQTMRLELSFTPEFRGEGTYGIYDMNDDSRLAPVLNDRANLKQYVVLKDGSRDWATSTVNADPKAASGQTLRYWAYFAAPEDDIDTIAVSIGMVEFDDVTITR